MRSGVSSGLVCSPVTWNGTVLSKCTFGNPEKCFMDIETQLQDVSAPPQGRSLCRSCKHSDCRGEIWLLCLVAGRAEAECDSSCI